ncbi:MAG: universal stress protein [Bacteroidota bacterium]|nr:universal stress protein [Bacteroidota bacterium]
MKTILVPTDFSPAAFNAMKYAAALATEVKSKLLLVHILELPVMPMESGMVLPLDGQLEDCKEELTRLTQKLKLENSTLLEIKTICQCGYFQANLCQLVRDNAVDLVVMGTRGDSNFLDKLLITTTAECIKSAICPILVVPAQANFTGIKHIALASDFENEETVFLQQLFCLAEPLQADVSIINIVSDRQLNVYPDNQVIKDITKHFPEKSISIAQIKKNNVIAGLQEFVQDNQMDVLALSMHERDFFENLFHKSVSKQLIGDTQIPLLALPEKPYLKPKPYDTTQNQALSMLN